MFNFKFHQFLLMSALLVTQFPLHAENDTTPTKQPEVSAASKTPDNEDQNPVSGYLTFTTNYVWRGITNSNNLPATQASLTYTFLTTGIYLNLWGSSNNLVAENGEQSTVEFDTIIGITNDIGENFNYNLSYTRYNYPKARSLEYNEFTAVATFYFFTGTIAYSGNEFNVHKPGTYYNGSIKIPLLFKGLTDLSLSAAFGHFQLPKEAGNSYNDYAITLTKDLKNFQLSLQWTDTNHKYYDNSFDHAFLIGAITANLS